MPLEFLWLQPQDISTTDDTFRVRSTYPDTLAASIRENGFRAPLLVQPAGDRYRLVSGWGRWEGRGEHARVPCYILPAGRAEEELWNVFLRDNDAWNIMEIARILRRLAQLPAMTTDKIVREKFSLIGLRRSTELYHAHLRLLRLPPIAQEFIEAEGLALRRASLFFKLPAETLPALLDAARALRLNLNEISAVLELIEEIARRDGLSPRDVLEAALSGGAGRTKSSFLERLRERRYPQLSKYRSQLQAWTSELTFSVPVKVEWDPQLERPGIRLIADLADADDLATLREELATEDEVLKRIFDIL